MFEVPTIDSTKRSVVNFKKLRYQYMNHMYERNRYNKNGQGLPTPVSSENEMNASEDEVSHKRVRKRWRRIVGESVSSDEEEEEEEEDEQEQEGDEEKKYFSRYDKPEDSFERWASNTKHRKSINRKMMSYKKYNKLTKYSRKKIQVPLIRSNRKLQENFLSVIDGYELIDDNINLKENFTMVNVKLLTDLMYESIFKENWKIAYRCFTLLIRLPKTSIRKIWNLGSMIIENLEGINKTIEFLKLFNNIHSRYKKKIFNQTVNYREAPVFNDGSRNKTPIYIKTLLWKEITTTSTSSRTSSNYNELIEYLSELTLIPPFMEDSEIWYIYGIVHLQRANELSMNLEHYIDNSSSSKDIANNEVVQNIKLAQKFLKKAKELSKIEVPERQITLMIKNIEGRMIH
ncbi:hypothetical protein Kpol_1037p11 [Vanderwaltozyma polyspora DSM 70294]|uniref:RNA polymerase I-specific transcription initiation factor RRN11 n=1 Tax=Vanderwaltozyma polyspora (strain ATCC 22028 / DSM 70294 / BCRC 21397 / CBS 2163 / NBRC 10782 / NRRL Y-8283 / UCD 57-17) TaxID=436907 RepID=A7TJV3_VANPO|nr:uncharacterized protein Kpol_1037p11 [Vanderwaltozyma polyspora DSM 70294]EDO17415.1 hypothetical protein Kpol_1037p11 [Vanderwaltozyma polyspora DSM 70294]